MMERRKFVQGAGGLLAMTALRPEALMAAEVLDIRVVELGTGLRLAKFQALLNQTFYIDTENSGVVTARLVNIVQPENVEPSPEPLEQFSLIFRGAPLPQLPADVYVVEHWLAGRTPLYLVPIAPSVYRADFCLLSR